MLAQTLDIHCQIVSGCNSLLRIHNRINFFDWYMTMRTNLFWKLLKLLPPAVQNLNRAALTEPAVWDTAAVELNLASRKGFRIDRPNYLYGLLAAARTAKACGIKEVTAIEFGVAGGAGLIAMESYAAYVRDLTGIVFQVHGFDSGEGLPAARTDWRDCPFAFSGGEFRVDREQLARRLKGARLWYGDVAKTIQQFIADASIPPIGFVSQDFDLYTSTRDTFDAFRMPHHRLLPRVTMYFDDLVGYPYSSVTGEWAAIEEFNAIETDLKIGQLRYLKYHLGRFAFDQWTECMYVLHVLKHPRYNEREVIPQPDLSLRA